MGRSEQVMKLERPLRAQLATPKKLSSQELNPKGPESKSGRHAAPRDTQQPDRKLCPHLRTPLSVGRRSAVELSCLARLPGGGPAPCLRFSQSSCVRAPGPVWRPAAKQQTRACSLTDHCLLRRLLGLCSWFLLLALLEHRIGGDILVERRVRSSNTSSTHASLASIADDLVGRTRSGLPSRYRLARLAGCNGTSPRCLGADLDFANQSQLGSIFGHHARCKAGKPTQMQSDCPR